MHEMRSRYTDYIREDIGSGDVTSELLVPPRRRASGRIIAEEQCVLAGAVEAFSVFEELGAEATEVVKEGTRAEKGDVVMTVKGSARALLSGERLALNFLMRMSGIATLTNDLLHRCRKINPKVRIAATRKTTPGFRQFEKRAVSIGGGDTHRFGLDDAILIKDNHIAIAGGIREALRSARQAASFTKKIEIEVGTVDDALTAVEEGADIIMLDNLAPEEGEKVAREVRSANPMTVIEVSGGIRPDNIEAYASFADIISLGWLTHSVRSIDFSMDIVPE
ncbi:MAG: carboxylating nicotinate-nucleotide diphosphorylase [Methanobacteriota archaeon]|nr:MAG: carboxylating nicotinate-nucleotide diphosphorylase [Euryarchaeota archaeon]